MIKIKSSSEIVADQAFFQRYPNIAFPSPITNAALADFGAEIVPEDTLQLKASARTKINAWRDEQETLSATFAFSGRMYDADLASKTRLSQLVELGGVPEGFYWTDAANADVPMDFAALKALGEAMTAAIVTRGWIVHRRQREMKAALEAMTIDQLKAFGPAWS